MNGTVIYVDGDFCRWKFRVYSHFAPWSDRPQSDRSNKSQIAPQQKLLRSICKTITNFVNRPARCCPTISKSVHVYVQIAKSEAREKAISEFQKPSLLKRGQVENLSCENEFYLHDNKKIIFALVKTEASGILAIT